MKFPSIGRVLKYAAVPLAAVAAATAAIAMSVQPVIIDLMASGRQTSQIVTVENTFQTPLPVEVRAQTAEWGATGLAATGTDADDILIFPPQTIIQPGRTQAFRVQYVGDPAITTSKHYFITVAQLPVKLPEGESAVQILYNFQVITSVGVPGARPELSITKAESVEQPDGKAHLALEIRNSANTYGYLSRGTLRIVQRDAANKEIFRKTLTQEEIQQQIGFGLMGAMQHRRFMTSLILPAAGGIVEADFTPSRS